MKIAKRKRYKNAVNGVVLTSIQIAEDPIKRRTDGASAFNTRTARGRLLLLDPARGEEKLRECSGSTTVWCWWSWWFSGRASPSTMEEEEVLQKERAAPGEGVRLPCASPLYIGVEGLVSCPPSPLGRLPRWEERNPIISFPTDCYPPFLGILILSLRDMILFLLRGDLGAP